VRFLIDECLTVDLVSVAGQADHDAQHVAHIGKAGWKDWNVEVDLDGNNVTLSLYDLVLESSLGRRDSPNHV
jgi:hypothetical protein